MSATAGTSQAQKSSAGGKSLLNLPGGEQFQSFSQTHTDYRLPEPRNRIYDAAIADFAMD
jgi:hypothetical protein